MIQRRFLAAVALGMFGTQSASLMLAPLLVAMATEFNTSVKVAGQFATVTFAAWAVSVVAVGPMSDSFGRRPVALTGLSLLSVGVLASAIAPNLETLMALRVVTGLGGGMIPPNSMAAVADSVPPARRAQVVGGVMAFATLSSVIGVPLVAVLADAGGWRISFLAVGSLLTACTLLNWFWFPKSDSAGLRSFSFFSRYRTLLAIPVFRAALAVNLSQRMAYIALFSYLAAYLINTYSMSVGAVAVPLAFVGIGTVIGSYIGGPIAGRKNRMTLVATSSLAGGVAALLLFLIEVPVWAAVATATGAVLLLSVAWPIMITFSAEVSSQSRATGVGLLGASNQSGGVGGAAIGGVLLATSGFPGRVPMSGRNGVLSVGHRAIHAPAQALNEAIWLEPQIAIVYGK
ncbi:MAG: MFS transporter [Dehalococcoidia bacterium]|nr:MFS transporter [Dehalococcoidia bacterium]